MSHSEYSLKIRLPLVLEGHLRNLSSTYDLSLNDVVKMVLSQHHLAHGLTPQVTPKLSISAKAEKTSLTPPSDVTHDPISQNEGKSSQKKKVTPPSDVKGDPKTKNATYIYNISNNKIFKYIGNNIRCSDPTLEEVWTRYQQFRKEKRKKIVPSQIEHIAKQFDKVIDAEGVTGLINRLNRSIANGWTGFVFANEELGKQEQNKRKFTEDDI